MEDGCLREENIQCQISILCWYLNSIHYVDMVDRGVEVEYSASNAQFQLIRVESIADLVGMPKMRNQLILQDMYQRLLSCFSYHLIVKV